MQLSQADMARLLSTPSPSLRAEVAGRVAAEFASGNLSEAERTLALEVLQLLIRDAEIMVRRAMAEHLAASMDVPHGMALALAGDVTEVALPMLQYSYVLTEDDLIAIVKSTSVVLKLQAVAQRASISSALSDALLESGQEKVIAALLQNGGASVAPERLEDILDAFESNGSVLEAMVQRADLPLALAEKLFALVTDEWKESLARRYHISSTPLDHAAAHATEWNTLGMIPKHATMTDLEGMAKQLHESGGLTPSLIVRSLCLGDLRFFEAAMARLAAIPSINARILMLDPGPLGFRALYEKAGLPEGFYDAIRAFWQAALEETAYGRFYRGDFKRRVLQRITQHGYDRSIEHMPYMMSLIGAKAGNVATVH